MKTMMIEDVIEVKVHNNREENLVNILKYSLIEVDKNYLKENTFGDDTFSIIRNVDVPKINGILSAMYFMDMLEKSYNAHNIPFYKENLLY